LAESGLLALVALVGILAVGRPVVNRLSAALVPPALAAALPGGGALPSSAALPPGAAPLAAGSTVAGLVGATSGAGPQNAAPGTAAAPGVNAAAALAAAAAGDEPQALGPPEALVALPNVQGQLRASSLNMVAELVEKHPGEALAVLRRWLTPQAPQDAAGGGRAS
jgi:flagellar M-ring protein FliF